MRLPLPRWVRRKDELKEELETHLGMAIQDRIDSGEPAEEARAAAMAEFGNVGLIQETTRQMWGWLWLERAFQDVRYALRQLRKAPGYTFAVVGTLALGMAATAAMFTLVDRVLLEPLPYGDAGRLVAIFETGKHSDVNQRTPFPDIEAWQQRSHSFSGVAFFDTRFPGFLEGNERAVHVVSTRISANLLPVLEVSPEIGRGFEEGRSGSVRPEDAHAILLSDAVWRGVYDANPKILGTTVHIDGEAYTVIGIMPPGFTFPKAASSLDAWTPIVLGKNDSLRNLHSGASYQVLARLKPGVSLVHAEAELKAIQAENAKLYTDPWDREQVASIRMQRYRDTLVGSEIRKALLALCAASGLLWLIACINVTSLFLARATTRRQEMAVRGALGASRARIVQQLLIEAMLLSSAAAVLGLLLAWLLLKLFAHALTTNFGIHATLAPNGQILCLLIALTVVTALLSSVWPAIGAARSAIEPALRQSGGQSQASKIHHRTRAILVVSQIAMSLTLLVGCGLLLRTIYALRQVPLGFRTDHIIVASLTIPSYKFANRDLSTDLYQPLLERVKHLPGVDSATLLSEVPLGNTFNMFFSFGPDGSHAITPQQRMVFRFRAVGPEMQKVFGFHMLAGRFFNEHDTPTSQAVVVVNRAFVQQYFGEDHDFRKILGKTLLDYSKDRRAVIVGVLRDERQVSVDQGSQPEIEVCLPQITPNSMFYQFAKERAMDVAVRTERNPTSMIPELRRVIRDASPDLRDTSFNTMEQIVEDSYGSRQMAARILEVFGGCALLLCITGIYGLLAYLVTERRREIGLRMALGAQRGQIAWLVLRQAAWMLVAGSAAGLLLADLTSLLLRSFLFGVRPHDPWTMGAVTAVLIIGGLSSAYLPARHAANVDPMVALRSE